MLKKTVYNSNPILMKAKQQVVLNRLCLNTVTGPIIAPCVRVIQIRQLGLWGVLHTSKLFTGAPQRPNTKREGECPVTVVLLTKTKQVK